MKRLSIFLVLALTASLTLATAEDRIKIAEVYPGGMTGGPPAFIELYNASTANVSLDNWRVRVYTSGGVEQAIIPSNTSIPTRGFLLIGWTADADGWGSESLKPDIYINFSNHPADARGSVMLITASNTVCDRVGWGTVPIPYYEGTPCAAMEAGTSLERKSGSAHEETHGNSYDTGDNLYDFRVRETPQPQNLNSPREYPSANTNDQAWGRIKAMYYGRR